MVNRSYCIFENFRKKKRCTYDEMYDWYANNCDKKDSLAIDKFYSAYWKAIDCTKLMSVSVIIALRKDCSSILVLKRKTLTYEQIEFKIDSVDDDSLRRSFVTKKKVYTEDVEGEIWKICVGHKDLEVSNFGRVRKIKTKQIIPGSDHKGYLRIAHSFIHRLVAQAFIPNPENKQCVNHIDGNKKNNCAENLEWCTLEENNKHAIEVLGSIERKLTIEQAEQIRKDVLNGKYKSVREIARKFNMNKDCIKDILENNSYKTETSKPVNIFKRDLKGSVETKVKKSIVDTVRDAFLLETIQTVKKLSNDYKLNEDTVLDIIGQNIVIKDYKTADNITVMKTNTSGYTNIVKFRTNRWRVVVTDKDKRKLLGCGFKTQKEALETLNDYIIKHNLPQQIQEYHGETMIINDYQKKVQKEFEEQKLLQSIKLKTKNSLS